LENTTEINKNNLDLKALALTLSKPAQGTFRYSLRLSPGYSNTSCLRSHSVTRRRRNECN